MLTCNFHLKYYFHSSCIIHLESKEATETENVFGQKQHHEHSHHHEDAINSVLIVLSLTKEEEVKRDNSTILVAVTCTCFLYLLWSTMRRAFEAQNYWRAVSKSRRHKIKKIQKKLAQVNRGDL